MKTIKIVYIFLQIHFALSNEVIFHLYNRCNPTNFEIINNSWYCTNHSLPFKFIIHGFVSKADQDWIIAMKNEYLNKGDYNIIAVDWSSIAGTNYFLYPRIINRIEYVANILASFILTVQTQGISLKNMHLIGHSLGGHIAGLAGKIVANANQGRKIGRITGLDPAGPGFRNVDTNKRIHQGDADFVDVIHTSMLGLQEVCGDCDFYVCDGLYQHGCMRDTFLNIFYQGNLHICSHSRAYLYFIESISSYKFVATQCRNYNDYEMNECRANPTTCMGENVNPIARGIFFLQTNDNSPFAKNGTITV